MNAHTKATPRQLTSEEAWQTTCHEAGHALVAARLGIPFTHVERGEGEHGKVEVGVGPIEDPEHNWTLHQISCWQQFHAAGAAAEKFLFGSYREYGVRQDRRQHAKLESRWRPGRSNGWEGDVQSAMNLLDREAIEKIAKELDRRGILSAEEVYVLLDCLPPWQ